MRTVNIFWFRRDLRLNDNAGLYHALAGGIPVIPIFIFDTNILNELEEKSDRRVEFIYAALKQMQIELVMLGSSLEVYHGTPAEVFSQLLIKYSINTVFTNHDYEPYAQERDKTIQERLKAQGVMFRSYKDQVIFEMDEVIKDNSNPYTVFTPYSRKWKSVLTDKDLEPYPNQSLFHHFHKQEPRVIPSLRSLGFRSVDLPFPSQELDEAIVKDYGEQRNFPGLTGTSKMGVHLRFGTVSIREIALKSRGLSETYLNELIWRDFYHMILWHFPRVGTGNSFKREYDAIEWRRDEGEFEKWCLGQTGYPIVDAGMRELNATGFMHNRLRMIVASFLSKHLLLDWRLGEAYFANKLLDFDLAANNGGWQWAAGSGCDAAPYFRIFNPRLQTEKFDPQHTYIKKWVPEYTHLSYPRPIVEHELARKRCLETYAKALKPNAA